MTKQEFIALTTGCLDITEMHENSFITFSPKCNNLDHALPCFCSRPFSNGAHYSFLWGSCFSGQH